jgi:beta-glucanase (GH16 family)
VAQAWEKFTLIDKNGGSLESGDLVYIKAGNGQYFMAANGGGSTLNAASNNELDWETFRIVKQNGGGTINNGDVIGLQTITSGRWVSAENGGGGPVFAYGPAFGPWEKLVIGLGQTTPVSDWRLVWSDEFNGSSIDESKWTWEVQRPGWVNHELQNYTNRRWENSRVENGHLVIEGRRDWYNGHEYSSARLKTQGRASWKYGRVEARIKLPGGWGTWPAFWMMPDNQSRGWPACGEIDIMEEVGYDQDSIHATTHSQAYNWKSNTQRTASTYVAGVTSDYHTYALEWYADHIDMFVDGRKYYTSRNDYTGDDAWPFDKNFHIILNLAIGGDWGAAQGVDPNIWPRQMLVDYVRVYQR